MIVSTVQHNAAVEIFRAELEQLGLPKEHSTAVGRVVSEHSDKIRDFLSQQSLSSKFVEPNQIKLFIYLYFFQLIN